MCSPAADANRVDPADAGDDAHRREVAAIGAILDRLELPGIIDVHTHFMPRQVLDKVWAYFDSAGPLIGRPWPINYRLEESARVERLRSFRVQRFTSMLYPHKPDMAAWLNSWSREFAAATPDCLHTATFYPEESAPDYVAAALDAGARVFKSHIQVGDYPPNHPLLDPVWRLLSDAGVPTVIHAGSGPAPGRHTGPEPVADVLSRFPDLPLIIAHLGMPEYREFFDLADRYPRVHLDTTMAFTDFTEETIPFPTDLHDGLVALGDKILFGSDFPNIPYSYQHALEVIEDLELGDEWTAKVLYHNGVRLFGTGEPE